MKVCVKWYYGDSVLVNTVVNFQKSRGYVDVLFIIIFIENPQELTIPYQFDLSDAKCNVHPHNLYEELIVRLEIGLDKEPNLKLDTHSCCSFK